MMNIQNKDFPHAKPAAVQEIDIHADSREILKGAVRDQKQFNLDDYFIVDVDSHIVETDNWPEVLEYIDDPVLRYDGLSMAANWPVSRRLALHCEVPGLMFQDAQGRIPHQACLAEAVDDKSVHRDVTLVRRAIDSFGFDLQIVFPQPMLEIGLHPNPDIASRLVEAFNKWFMEHILPKDNRMRSMLPLPFEDPDACLRTIKTYSDHPQVIGFMVTSQRHAGVHRNQYLPIYHALEERGMPLAFHAGPTQSDSQTSTTNRFISAHALSFVTCNMMHLTNWIINGLPERFPKLKVIWVESGLAWLPFMMQRLDTEFLKRPSDAPSLKRIPSEYMTDMFYTAQPMEDSNHELLESTFKAIKAEKTLMYSSDWPHWDFDLPGGLFSLPFVTEPMRRNILGETARKLFNL